MAKFIGRLIDVGIGKETTRGTAVAPAFWIPKRDMDFTDANDRITNESGYSVLDKNSGSNITKRWGEGSISGKVYDKSIGLLLAGVNGQLPTSEAVVGETGAYDHTFDTNQEMDGLTLTLAVKDPLLSLRFPNTVVDSFALHAVVDDYVNHETSFISRKSVETANTVAYAVENQFVPKHAHVYFADDVAGLASADEVPVRSFDLEINNNAEQIQNIGADDISDVVPTAREITGSIEMYYDSTDFRDYFFDDTRKAMKIAIINNDVTIGSTTSPSLTITLPSVAFTGFDKGQGNDDIVMQTIDFTVTFDVTTGYAVRMVLRNEQASY